MSTLIKAIPPQAPSLVPYPDTWPKAKGVGFTLAHRITEQQKIDLFNRKITTRDLAKLLNVREEYLSTVFPGKIPATKAPRRYETERRALLDARKQFRVEQAYLVLAEKQSIKDAAKVCNTSYRNMARFVQALKEKNNG